MMVLAVSPVSQPGVEERKEPRPGHYSLCALKEKRTYLSPCLPPLLGFTKTSRGWVPGVGMILYLKGTRKRN
jgi:hypothetical protein